jgi:hypothetical protein
MAKTKKILSPAEKLKEICPLLAAVGVTGVSAEYEGSGDSGDFSNISFWFGDRFTKHDSDAFEASTNGRRMYLDEFKRTHTLPNPANNMTPIISAEKFDEFEDTLFDLLPGGWEINEGSYGEVEIDVLKSKVKHEHNERVVETNTTTNEW